MPLKRFIRNSKHTGEQLEINARGSNGIVCQEFPCNAVYVPIELYAIHMRQYHDHCCEECQKNLVNEHLLQLHLHELHNPFVTHMNYRCFEEQCDEQFNSHSERTAHLKSVHRYPETFNFDIVKDGACFE